MFKLYQAIKGLREALAGKHFVDVVLRAADALEAFGKGEQADALREVVKGVEDANAREIAVGAAHAVFDVLEGYYEFDHVTVKALPGVDADEARAAKLEDHLSRSQEASVTGSPRVTALPPEVWAALANVLSNLILKLIEKRRAQPQPQA